MTARVVKREQQYPKHPAVTRHPAFPDAQDRQRLTQHFRFVEENVPEPTANDHAEERATGDEVAYALWRQIGVSALGQPDEKKIAGHKRQHVSKPIPSWSDVVVDPENDRIEIMQVVGEHLRRDCGFHSERSRGCNVAAAGGGARFSIPLRNLQLIPRDPSLPFRSAQDDSTAFGPDVFKTFRKNGAVRLIRFFATCSGVPKATTSPPASPASGPRSTI